MKSRAPKPYLGQIRGPSICVRSKIETDYKPNELLAKKEAADPDGPIKPLRAHPPKFVWEYVYIYIYIYMCISCVAFVWWFWTILGGRSDTVFLFVESDFSDEIPQKQQDSSEMMTDICSERISYEMFKAINPLIGLKR